MSAIDLSLYFISNVSLLYLFPLQISHSTYTSAKKCISIFLTPSPSQFSHRPPLTLNENLPGLYPLAADSFKPANQSRIGVKQPVYVAGLDLGVLPIGDWFISIILSIFFTPMTL